MPRAKGPTEVLVERGVTIQKVASSTRPKTLDTLGVSKGDYEAAKDLYVSKQLPLKTVALQTGLPIETLHHFAYEKPHKWYEARLDASLKLAEEDKKIDSLILEAARPKLLRFYSIGAELALRSIQLYSTEKALETKDLKRVFECLDMIRSWIHTDDGKPSLIIEHQHKSMSEEEYRKELKRLTQTIDADFVEWGDVGTAKKDIQ